MTHRWRKSSHSSSATSCVEVSGTLAQVRDSKNPTGPVLHADVTVLVTRIKTGGFRR